jgi:EAL domain-containing protein (putative c-di-GMP-specific phosphodiesterase class I)
LDQLAALLDLNCEYGQGYFFSPPLDPFSARKFMSNGDLMTPVHAKPARARLRKVNP